MLALHFAFVLILAGAFITHFWGEQAMLSLRVGETGNKAVTEQGSEMTLPFDVTLKKFSIKTYDDGKTHKNYISRICIDNGSDVLVAMNHPYLHGGYSLLQMYYDSDLHGTTLLVQHDPYGVGVTFCGYYILLAACALILTRHIYRYRKNKGFMCCLGISAIGSAVYVVKKLCFSGAPLMPVLNSPYLVVHVSIIIVAYMLMICMLVISAKALWQKQKTAFQARVLLLPAILFLTAGIFIGAIWANNSWGRYWGWDPKETWALITMIVYSLPLHHRKLNIFSKPAFFHAYLCLAFICVLVTYFGVNYFLGGLHSYA